MQSLSGKRVLILVSSGVDESETSLLQRELLKTGAEFKTVATSSGLINSWNGKGWGIYFTVDSNVNATLGSDFDMLVVPSGKLSVEKLASNEHTKRIISHFMAAGKPMAFMGDAVTLIENMSDNVEDIAFITSSDDDANSSVANIIEYFSLNIAEEMKEAA